MRPIGFSTGALAYSDFRRGLEMTRRAGCPAVELSALRQDELLPLVASLDDLDLSGFDYISIHAPSQMPPEMEASLFQELYEQRSREWPIVVHPDALTDFSLWRLFGDKLCIENMDKRKPIGRSAAELAQIFDHFPNASLCFDIGHARQVDPTMTEAWRILRRFGQRLRQVHVSEVNTASKHDTLSFTTTLGFQEVAHLIPEGIPLILETPVSESDMLAEISKVRKALPVKRETRVA